ncbi:microcin C transport system substrate-binding protein [Gammaproteobacteria bacterium]
MNFIYVIALLFFSVVPVSIMATPVHGLAMHGDLKYRSDFSHFEYVNPEAPRGGTLHLAAIGTYDSLNPFILKGIAPASNGFLFDTLAVQSQDEPFSEYGLVAETIETPPDRSWVEYTLRREARFHDGSPIGVADIIWSFETLKAKGHPFYRNYYSSIINAESVGARTVRFTFATGSNRELPLILGQMPILSKIYWEKRDFDKTTLEPPLSSGPYQVEKMEPGRSITYQRVADYWGKDLPVNRGRYNFDRIQIDYYRDSMVALEALKAGEYDLRVENIAKNWANAYDVPAVRDGWLKKVEISNDEPAGMQAFFYNTRRPVFHDRRVREALAYAFDFQWTNKNLFHSAYTRTTSFFANSELAARGLPSPAELTVLTPFRGKIPEEVFNREYQPPVSDGSGQIRDNLRLAMILLKQAGWSVKEQRMINETSGQPLEFEVLLSSSDFERVVLPFVRNLERLGIMVRIRTVDPTQYQNRIDSFDYDLTVEHFSQSLSPGNEQRDLWSSEYATREGSRNISGVRDPVVDQLVEQIIAAKNREELVTRTRSLDRVLLWSFYVIPHWHLNFYRVAYWDKLGRPNISPRYALGLETWWLDQSKETKLQIYRSSRR